MNIRVLVADDHRLVRQGIRSLLEADDEIEVIGEAENGEQVLSCLELWAPDILILDVSMPKMNGLQVLDALREWSQPPAVIMLSMFNTDVLVKQALAAGAAAYVPKQATVTELVKAVKNIAANHTSAQDGAQAPEERRVDPLFFESSPNSQD